VRPGLLLSLIALVAAACSHAVVVPAPEGEPTRVSHDGAVVWVAPAIDGRRGDAVAESDPRHLGWRRNNVGSGQRPITLDRPVAEWVTQRLVAVLASHGLAAQILLPGAPAPAVWLQPTLDRLELSAGTEDRFSTSLSLALHRRGAGAPVWQRTAQRDHAEFTGVGGTAMAHLALLVQKEIDGLWGELLRDLGDESRAASTPSTGALQIDTAPAGARVYLDGAYYGTTPFRLDLSPGVHELRLEHPGYPAVTQRVGIAAGRTTAFTADLSQPHEAPDQGP
jgi:hypothetical protein